MLRASPHPNPPPQAGEGADRGAAGVGWPFPHGPASLARWRSAYFWILPVEVFGNGPKTTVFGALKWARLARHHRMMSAAVTSPASGFSVTKAHGVSPQTGSGRATTAASMTIGWL